jgi:rhodanese-related sulfurtransferase
MQAIIQTEQLRSELESPNPPILIDVRLENEFQAAHISGAVNNCVYEVAFGKRMIHLAPEKNRPIVVYGANSASYEARTAAAKLGNAGYVEVYEYRDGLAAWQAAGAPIDQGERQPAEPAIADGLHSIDLKESSIEWTGRNLLKKHHGRIELKSGHLQFVQGKLVSGHFVIDLRKIVCFDLEGSEWHDVLIHHLRSDDFFEVDRFPEAVFVIKSARELEGANRGQCNIEVTGDLTLKGLTAPLTLCAAAGVTPDGKPAAQAVFSFDRTRWNVVYGAGRFFDKLGMHLVNDLVDMDIKIVTTW